MVPPQPACSVGGEILDDADALRRQMRQQDFAVHRMGRIIGGGQGVSGVAERDHVERGDRAVIVIDHSRGEVRGEILDPFDGLLHRIPPAHGVEHRVSDALHRRRCAHAVIQRIRILQGPGAEELDGLIHDRHGFRLNATRGSVNGVRQS